eukprot:c23702_g1_i1 orf=265-3186(+)
MDTLVSRWGICGIDGVFLPRFRVGSGWARSLGVPVRRPVVCARRIERLKACGLASRGVVGGSLVAGRSKSGKGNARGSLKATHIESPEVTSGVEEEHHAPDALRVALICGGPSAERGISMNSARSVLDHLQGEDVSISCYYLDRDLCPFKISTTQMYSNTPSDFDFKINSMGQIFQSNEAFMEHLRSSVDIVFPLIHGRFGEDGGIQELLEDAGIPYIGTGPFAARRAFDKFNAFLELERHGFATIPSFLIEGPSADKTALASWFESNGLDTEFGRVVVKPACAGSSVGVSVAHGVEETAQRAESLVAEGLDDRVVIEDFVENGKEFTAIVLDVGLGNDSCPVVLLPTEVELQMHALTGNDAGTAIFDYRRKYLPTRQVKYHTPPRFPLEVIQEIRRGAAELFKKLHLKDFARIDGWFLPPSKFSRMSKKELTGELEMGTVVFSDINLVSGMEQTSFLFQQSAQVGLSHVGVLRMILLRACSRFPQLSHWRMPCISNHLSMGTKSLQNEKKMVFVIFGGETSERQVSLLSGTNVWLNLRRCDDLCVVPFLLAPERHDLKSKNQNASASSVLSRKVWALPYSLLLRHTVEEVVEACLEALEPSTSTLTSLIRDQAISQLNSHIGVDDWTRLFDVQLETPRQLTLAEWVKEAKEENAIVFNAVHGGIGENGTLQEILENSQIPYTGSGAQASRICMDKAATATALAHLSSEGVHTTPKEVWDRLDVLERLENIEEFWEILQMSLNAASICVKPASDGCSTGVARLCCSKDLTIYLEAVKGHLLQLPPNVLSKGNGVIEMPDPPPEKLLFEPFIETDEILISSNQRKHDSQGNLQWEKKSRWIEVTVGVMGLSGKMYAFNPSITVKERGDILSLEEKFQGGTGVNLTPPPPSIVREAAVNACRQRIQLVASALELEGFARIDAFLHAETGEIIVIEVNTVPGMTPSTVLIHQALAELPPVYPRMFYRKIVDLALLQ